MTALFRSVSAHCRCTACSPPCCSLPASGLNEGAPPFRLLPAAKKSAGTLCQVDGRKSYLERFRGNSVPGGRQEDVTWNAFAGIPCQVGGRKSYLERFRRNTVAGGRRERTSGTLLRENRAKWTAGSDTWYTFAGKPCQVGGRERHLPRFCGDSVPGGRQEVTPGTLSLENRGRWKAEKRHLEHFRWKTVAGGRQRKTPGTLSREFRARGGYLSAGTYCGTPPVLPALRAPSLLGSRCRLRPQYVPVIPHSTGS